MRGFTIIELLIVIAIIGILSSVSVSVFADVRDKAEAAAFKSEAVSLIPVLALYCQDGVADENLPSGSTHGGVLQEDIGCLVGGGWDPISIEADTLDCTATILESGVSYVGSQCS